MTNDAFAPLITVGITCYNAAETIERAVRCAMLQDWSNLEILVADDCSTDGSVTIVERLAQSDPRIRLIRHPQNTGSAGARNTLITQANGEFVAFFDDDDESMPSRIRQQYERIAAYEYQMLGTLIFCYVGRLVQIDGIPDKTYGSAIGSTGIAPHGKEVLDYLFWHIAPPDRSWGSMGSGTMMARKSSFEAAGGFDTKFRRSEEWDIAIRLAMMGGHFIGINEPLIIQHVTRSADKAGKIPLTYGLMLRYKYKSFLKRRHGYLASLACAYSRFYYARAMMWRSRFWLFAACLASPHICLREQVRRKFFA